MAWPGSRRRCGAPAPRALPGEAAAQAARRRHLALQSQQPCFCAQGSTELRCQHSHFSLGAPVWSARMQGPQHAAPGEQVKLDEARRKRGKKKKVSLYFITQIFQQWASTSCQISGSIRLEIKWTINVMCLNHPKIIPSSCLEKPMDGGARWAAVHGVAKSRTRLSGFTFTFHFSALEKEMATHSCVLAWRIPGRGEADGLPSVESHRVGHDWSDLAAAVCGKIVFHETGPWC